MVETWVDIISVASCFLKLLNRLQYIRVRLGSWIKWPYNVLNSMSSEIAYFDFFVAQCAYNGASNIV